MGNGLAIWQLSCRSLRVYVNSLIVVSRLRELVNPLLIDNDPVRNAQFRSLKGLCFLY